MTGGPGAEAPLRVALLGYGLAGRVFHAPLVRAEPELELLSVVTSNEARAAQALADNPGVRVLASADEVWDDASAYDLVVVGTANIAHVPQATAALEAGLSVVVDKPLAATAAQAEVLVELAGASPGQLHVFQNRRWDSDTLTVGALLQDGRLGRVHRMESRFERWRPEPAGTWRDSGSAQEVPGLLYDLGAHLVDQALHLLGPAVSVFASVRSVRTPGAPDDDTQLLLSHASGAVTYLAVSAVAAFGGPRLRLLGTDGGFEVAELDSQEDRLRAGGTPADPGWGEEPQSSWGSFVGRDGSREAVPAAPGRWGDYYAGVVASLREGAPAPVDPRDVVQNLRVIEAAALSARAGRVVVLEPPAGHGA